jgi:hypothetical protein
MPPKLARGPTRERQPRHPAEHRHTLGRGRPGHAAPGAQSAACGKAAVLPAAVLARLGLPALAALVLLCVLLLAVICWIISNGDRSDRLNRMMLALQGKASCLAPRPCTASELAAGAVTCGLAG